MFLVNGACTDRGKGMPRVHRRIAWEVKAGRHVSSQGEVPIGTNRTRKGEGK